MSEYPDSDEEFELQYGDELELLNETEGNQHSVLKSHTPARRRLGYGEFTQSNILNTQSDIFSPQSQSNGRNGDISNNKSSDDIQPISDVLDVGESSGSVQNETSLTINSSSTQPAKKRTIEELFGDIDDLLFENESRSKKSKASTKLEQQMEMIEKILELRNQRVEGNPLLCKSSSLSTVERNKQNLSRRVPTYPFIRVTRHDDEKLYIRCHSESYEKEDVKKVINEINFVGVMGDMFKKTWQKAHEIINKEYDANTVSSDESMDIIELEEDQQLWVDLYKPKRYLELLSDEGTNRVLLKWIKLWDKAVFNRRPKVKPTVDLENKTQNKKFFFNLDDQLTLDEDGRPTYKVALLSGRPGLGKTTLAHVVAKHAGYNVIEINASDDRSLEIFKKSLENATQMRSVLDQQKRPNCIVFDEIDGAPTQSIEFLVKFVSGTVPKSKKKDKENAPVLKRPIICICNDPYVPALRSLRQIAFLVNFPPISSARLSERLMEIARRQQLKTDMGTMLALAEKSDNDIRCCLSMLNMFKANKRAITLSDVYKSSIGQKDMHKGLFAVWSDIFTIERAKVKFSGVEDIATKDQPYDMSSRARMNKILAVIQSFGDYERLAQGVFENYPEMQIKEASLLGTCHALDWFCLSDKLNKFIMSEQNYSLNSYVPYAFVVWHFQFASLIWSKIKYPNMGYEVRQRLSNNLSVVKELQKGMQPKIKVFLNEKSLILDVLHPLIKIISPPFRPVNLYLFTDEEKKMLTKVVDVMIDYNLTYIQEKNVSGIYEFKLEPDVLPVVMYPNPQQQNWHLLSYFNRQLIAREIELGKIKKLQPVAGNETSNIERNEKGKNLSTSPEDQSKLPNHLQRLKVKTVKKDVKVITKDFFGRHIKSPEGNNTSGSKGPQLHNDIWYRYKEGYSNAVKKKITISSLR